MLFAGSAAEGAACGSQPRGAQHFGEEGGFKLLRGVAQCVVRGGANGLILATDIAAVSKLGHTTVYPSRRRTIGTAIALTNNTVPEQYAWHLEGNINDANDDLQTNNATLTSMLSSYGLPQRQVNINEYATFDEQVSAGAAWWISRLERYDTIGLRGNWLSGCALHDLFGSLLGKPNAQSSSYPCTGTGYYPNGEWEVYKYYNLNMTGNRVKTTGTGDRIMDVYATAGDKVRILTGVRLQTGTWYITVNNLSSFGLPTSGTLNIQTWGFDDKGHYGEVDGPSDRGVYGHTYSGNSVTFPVYQTSQDEYTAWGFEFSK